MTMMGNATHQRTAVTKSGLVNQQLKLMKLGARRPLFLQLMRMTDASHGTVALESQYKLCFLQCNDTSDWVTGKTNIKPLALIPKGSLLEKGRKKGIGQPRFTGLKSLKTEIVVLQINRMTLF